MAAAAKGKIIEDGLLRWISDVNYQSDCFGTYPSSGNDAFYEYRAPLP